MIKRNSTVNLSFNFADMHGDTGTGTASTFQMNASGMDSSKIQNKGSADFQMQLW